MCFDEFLEHKWINVEESVEEIKERQNKALRFIQKYIFRSLREDLDHYIEYVGLFKSICT
jgi:hypothetical protein